MIFSFDLVLVRPLQHLVLLETFEFLFVIVNLHHFEMLLQALEDGQQVDRVFLRSFRNISGQLPALFSPSRCVWLLAVHIVYTQRGHLIARSSRDRSPPVPTPETFAIDFILDLLIPRRYPALLVGEAGTGKTQLALQLAVLA